jgi:hypothetical protein
MYQASSAPRVVKAPAPSRVQKALQQAASPALWFAAFAAAHLAPVMPRYSPSNSATRAMSRLKAASAFYD